MSAAAAANPFADDAQSGSSSIDHSGNPFADSGTGSAPAGGAGGSYDDTSLDKVANAPNDIPLDSYAHATERGIANIGQGAAQAVQAAGQMIFHSDQASKGLIEGAKNLPSQAAALVKDPPSLKDIGDAAGTTAGNLAAGEIMGAGARGAGKVLGKTVDAATEYAKTRTTPTETKIAAPIKATVPEAAMQPDKAVAATDRLVRAAAPTATDVRARSNFHAAAGDLAQVADKVEWDKVRGGKGLTEGSAAPDMRPRAVLQAVNERMGDMYKAEVEPKIQAMEGVPAKLSPNPDAYKFLATTAGDETTRSLAQKAAAHPESLTVPEAYQLSRAVNAELVKFESLPADQQYLARTTNPAINKLDGLDESLNQNISQAFKDRGIGGIDNFNRRYAAMASVRRGLNIRVNAAELQRQGTLAKIGKGVRAVTGKNVNAIASASQASLADVNIGDQLERGLKDLKQSGVKPNLDPTPGAPKLALKSPPGKLPPARQEGLPLVSSESRSAAPETIGDAHQVPGPPDAKLSSPGSAAPDAQRPFSFMDSPSPDRSGSVYPEGQGLQKPLSKAPAPKSGKAPGLVGNNYLEKPNVETSARTSEQPAPKQAQKTNSTSSSNPFATVETDRAAQTQAKTELGSATHPDFLKRAQDIKQQMLSKSAAASAPSTSDMGVIGTRLAKPRTPNAPLEHGFDFRPAEDLGNAAREASQKKQGPIARGERRVQPRSPEEQRTQQLFADARKELGEDATSDEVMARVEQKKSQTAKPGMMRALSKKKGA